MGVVYQARDMHLDRMVALKILPHDKVADPGRKQRFIQEAKAASALNHPNIVTIHDIRSHNGVDFIVMECIAGQTLDALISSGACGRAGAEVQTDDYRLGLTTSDYRLSTDTIHQNGSAPPLLSRDPSACRALHYC